MAPMYFASVCIPILLPLHWLFDRSHASLRDSFIGDMILTREAQEITWRLAMAPSLQIWLIAWLIRRRHDSLNDSFIGGRTRCMTHPWLKPAEAQEITWLVVPREYVVFPSVCLCAHVRACVCVCVYDPVCISGKVGVRLLERWEAGVETQKNVRGEIGGWGRVPFNEPYAPSLSTIYDGA